MKFGQKMGDIKRTRNPQMIKEMNAKHEGLCAQCGYLITPSDDVYMKYNGPIHSACNG